MGNSTDEKVGPLYHTEVTRLLSRGNMLGETEFHKPLSPHNFRASM
jgi:hypothetical protein